MGETLVDGFKGFIDFLDAIKGFLLLLVGIGSSYMAIRKVIRKVIRKAGIEQAVHPC